MLCVSPDFQARINARMLQSEQPVIKASKRMKILYKTDMRSDVYNDKTNCSVRALAHASGMPMHEAEKLLAPIRMTKRGRLSGPPWSKYTELLTDLGFKTIGLGRRNGSVLHIQRVQPDMIVLPCTMTLQTVILTGAYSTGRHIIGISGHALAMVNGKLMDSGDSISGGTRVFVIYTLKG